MSELRHDTSKVLEARTAAFYDAYPFEFLTPQDEAGIEQMQPAPFRRFVERFAKTNMEVGEVGCGPGRATAYLCQKGLSVTAFDISQKSIDLAHARAKEAKFIRASALALPCSDESFDMVVCDGVIHHTPDARAGMAECARVLRRGGMLYLGVYNRNRYYYYIYTYFWPLVRFVERAPVGRFLVYATVFPLYYLVHLIKSRGRRSILGARNFFYDYLITPQASFHRREEVMAWAAALKLQLVDYDDRLGNVHVFWLLKPLKNDAS
jgi:ubiquinone/menaquinone biosynthesis C-methylase UbiE